MADTESPPEWLTKHQASALLKDEFNVTLSSRTIENKVYSGDIPYEYLAGQLRINRDKLRVWARPTKANEGVS